MTASLDSFISNPSAATAADAEALARRYPFFISPDVEALASAGPEERTRLKRRIAAFIGSTDVLRNLFGPDGDIMADFYPDMHAPAPSTSDAIDTFLNKFAGGAPAGPDPLDFAPAVDYAAILEAEEKGEQPPVAPAVPIADEEPHSPAARSAGESAESLAGPAAAPAHEAVQHKPAESAPLSESLAAILIKNRNYSKALEILSQLSLNNPEKSVYFADQIRFLRKLIVNDSYLKVLNRK